MKTWKCKECGYIHIDDEPPSGCPICGAGSQEFVQIADYKIKNSSLSR